MNARRNKHARRRGFTVVELTIGMTVMLVAVMTTMASQLVALDLVKSLREQNAAMSDLQSAMDEVQLLPPDDIPIATSLYADGQPIAAYTNLHLPNQTITPDYPGFAGATIPDPLPIVLTCAWTDWKGRQRTMRLNSAVTR
ncbi:MAG: type II secretion system GspH family protein [Planctomycetes bacterium]|nr:type II secretion system GspH family protein [Planctomycetota bacterium]